MISNNTIPIRLKSPSAYFLSQAVFGTAFTYLTSGVFLSGLALMMGAGDVLVSYLSIILNICGVLILVFSAFLERFQSRKKLTISLTVLSRIATLFIVAIPILVPERFRLVIFILAVVIAFTLQAQTTVVLNQWMLLFIDEKRSGRYISIRQTMTLITTVVLSALGGWWMDFMEGKYLSFVLLFSVAALMGLMEIFLLIHAPDGPGYESLVRGQKIREIVGLPLKNRAYTGFILYVFMFYLILYVGDSYTMVYMMKYLALPYKTVTMMYMIISLPQIILLSMWGKISDKWGHKFVLKTSIWLFTGETLFMFFASPKSWFIFIPIAFIISSVANSGFVIAVFNRRYELMPKENRIVYDNFYTAAIGVGFIFGPMFGGIIKRWLETITSLETIFPFASIRLLYLVSTIGIILLQIVYSQSQRRAVHIRN